MSPAQLFAGSDHDIAQVRGLLVGFLLALPVTVCQVSKGVNGLLLQQLAFITGYEDAESVQFFRRGAPFLERFPCSGVGTPRHDAVEFSEVALREQAQQCCPD